jgi:uncharacterized protein (DUF1778 family)
VGWIATLADRRVTGAATVATHDLHVISCQYHRIDKMTTNRDDTRVKNAAKTGQLQIRVSESQKIAIQRAATRAGMDMSSYVLSRVLSVPAERFQDLIRALPTEERIALAELNTYLSSLTVGELREALAAAPAVTLSEYWSNCVAAMVELACVRRGIEMPPWVQSVAPLREPVFATALQSLRLYLLTHTPGPFRRRNLFVDSSVGDRV